MHSRLDMTGLAMADFLRREDGLVTAHYTVPNPRESSQTALEPKMRRRGELQAHA